MDLQEEEMEVIKFLKESNAIEREYSQNALEDSMKAWHFGLNQRMLYNKWDLEVMLGIHHRLMKNLNPRIAGKIRTCDVWVGRRKCLSSKKINSALEDWFKSPYKTAAAIKKFHVRFEKIHPFEDGNGRTGRIIMNLQRLTLGFPILIIREGKQQMEYYKWFE